LVRWGTTEPVDEAIIELRNTSNPSGIPVAITATTGGGRFSFSNVTPGSYRLVAVAAGFAVSEFGQLRMNGAGRPVSVSPGEQISLQMQIIPGGIISGRVTDQNGQPVVYSPVQILKIAYDTKGEIAPALAMSLYTNDLGDYRAFWLPPGSYVVNASSARLSTFANHGITNPSNSDTSIPTTRVIRTGRTVANPPADSSGGGRPPFLSTLYYGNTPDVRHAEVINLPPGGEITGIDLRLNPESSTTNPILLRGMVVDPLGRPVQGNFGISIADWPTPAPSTFASVRLITVRAPSADPAVLPGAEVYVTDNGKFDGTAMPGVYQVRATQGQLSGRAVIEVVNRDLDITVPLRPPSTVSGKVIVDGGAANSVGLTALAAGIQTPPAFQFTSAVGADGQFRIEGAIPGDYRVFLAPLLSAPTGNRPTGASIPAIPAALQNAYVKSIRSGSTDLINGLLRVEGNALVEPIEIVLGLNAGVVTGRVLDVRKEPVSQATIVLLPPGEPPFRSDRYKIFTTAADGRFQFSGVPPGNYRLFAWEDIDAGAWFNRSYLTDVESYATILEIAEGQKKDLEIRVIPATR
jgi:hypothetical protein